MLEVNLANGDIFNIVVFCIINVFFHGRRNIPLFCGDNQSMHGVRDSFERNSAILPYLFCLLLTLLVVAIIHPLLITSIIYYFFEDAYETQEKARVLIDFTLCGFSMAALFTLNTFLL